LPVLKHNVLSFCEPNQHLKCSCMEMIFWILVLRWSLITWSHAIRIHSFSWMLQAAWLENMLNSTMPGCHFQSTGMCTFKFIAKAWCQNTFECKTECDWLASLYVAIPCLEDKVYVDESDMIWCFLLIHQTTMKPKKPPRLPMWVPDPYSFHVLDCSTNVSGTQ
jgi:hypothetical protein